MVVHFFLGLYHVLLPLFFPLMEHQSEKKKEN